jgi:hypothetical protein
VAGIADEHDPTARQRLDANVAEIESEQHRAAHDRRHADQRPKRRIAVMNVTTTLATTAMATSQVSRRNMCGLRCAAAWTPLVVGSCPSSISRAPRRGRRYAESLEPV